MPLPTVADLSFIWSDQSHRKLAGKLAAYVDRDYYLSTNPDVMSAGLDPTLHYVKYGWREGRDPSPSFSTQAYLAEHPELVREQTNPLLHFLENTPTVQAEDTENDAELALVATELDRAFYTRTYGLSAEDDPVRHYCRDGWRAGYDPSPAFSTTHYLTANVDIRNSGVNPFWHYLAAGREEGRSPKHEGGWRYEVLTRQQPLERMKEDWLRREAPPRLMSVDQIVKRVDQACDQEQVLISIGHDDYRSSAGGVQLCIALEAKAAVGRGVDYLSLHPWQSLPTLAAENADPIIAIVANSDLLGHARMSKLVSAAKRLSLKAPHIVIHHLMGQTPERLVEFAHALGVTETFLWLHDNFTLCPNYALQRNNVAFCNAPAAGSTACMICVYGRERLTHQARIEQLFQALDVHLLAPSKVALDYWKSRSALGVKSTQVHPHLRLRRRTAARGPDPAERCRIAFVGLPAPHKGWPLFQELQRRFASDDRYEFWHFSSEPTAAEMRHVPLISSADQPDAMAQAIRDHRIDLVIHWASCRETFSFSTHEALAGGAYVVTHEGSGNVAAVVGRQKSGRVLPDEAAFWDWVQADGLLTLSEEARGRRAGQAVSLSYSRFTLDHLPLEVEIS